MNLLRDSVARAPFVGRHDDLVALLALLDDASVRLVTVTGAGGMGKTRLAAELVRRVPDRNVIFVELASIGEPSLVLTAIASELSLNVPHARSAAVDIANELAHSRSVLVLDNFEHLTDATDDVLDVLARVPSLQIIVTSRVPLGVRSERVWRLGPLGLPDELGRVTGDESALALFRSVAEAADARLRLGPEHFDDIGAICRRLGGHPLAIELAASRSATLGPAALRAELERRSPLDVVRDSTGDRADRHRDLRVMIGWTCARLGDVEQAVFRRMSVFESWVDLEMVERICADGSLVSSSAVLDAVSTLVDHHLVDATHAAHDSRYRIPRPIQDVATEQLGTSPDERDATFSRHRLEHQRLARGCVERADEADGLRWLLDAIAAEADLLVALERARGANETTAAVELAAGLARVWLRRGSFPAHVVILDAVTRLDGFDDVDELTQLLYIGRSDEVRAMSGAVDAAHLRASADLIRTRIAARTDQPTVRRAAVLRLGLRLAVQGVDFDLAWQIGSDLLALPIEDDRSRGIDEVLVGMVAHQREDTSEAIRLGTAGLARSRVAADTKNLIRAGLLLQPLVRRGLAPPSIAPDLDEVARLADELGDNEASQWVRLTLGGSAVLAGDKVTVASLALSGLRRSSSLGAVHGAVLWAIMIAITSAPSEPRRTAVIHGALGARGVIGQGAMLARERALYDATLTHVQTALGPEQFDEAVREGAALGWPRFIAELTEHLDSIAETSTDTSIDGGSDPDVAEPRTVDEMTAREVEVLHELARGRTNREIARVLGMSPKTVMHHTTAIYRKLGVRGRVEATAAAHRRGLVDSSLDQSAGS